MKFNGRESKPSVLETSGCYLWRLTYFERMLGLVKEERTDKIKKITSQNFIFPASIWKNVTPMDHMSHFLYISCAIPDDLSAYILVSLECLRICACFSSGLM